MLLGCNYSSELIELLKEGTVDIDYIKLGLYDLYNGVYEEALSFKPILLHGLGFCERASMQNIEQIDWNYVNTSFKVFKSPHYAIHLLAHSDDFFDTSATNNMVEYMMKVVDFWKQNCNIPLLVENAPYSNYDEKEFGVIRFCTDANFINDVISKCDVDLLLDLSHAKVASFNRGENIFSYLNKLPLNRVKEIHVSGSEKVCNELRDKHIEMNDDDYEILKWTLNNTSPNIVTLEYGGPGEIYSWRSNKNSLKYQLIKLRGIIDKY